jgi:hypothetical protein
VAVLPAGQPLPPSNEAHVDDVFVPPSSGTAPPVTIEQYWVAESHWDDPQANGCPALVPASVDPALEEPQAASDETTHAKAARPS